MSIILKSIKNMKTINAQFLIAVNKAENCDKSSENLKSLKNYYNRKMIILENVTGHDVRILLWE